MFLQSNLRMHIRNRDKMKLQMHLKSCSNPPVAFDKIRVSKKACMMREQQLNEYERIRKVHN